MKAGKSVDDAAAAYQLPAKYAGYTAAARARESERHGHLRRIEEVDPRVQVHDAFTPP